MAEEITIDQFFLEQQEAPNLFTLDPVPDKPQMVKMTPWAGSQVCQCSASLVVARDSVAGLTKTNLLHDCCGKRLQVVGVKFREGAQIPVADVLKQLASAAAQPIHLSHGFSSQQMTPFMGARSSGSLLDMARAHMSSPAMARAPCVPVCMCWPDGCLCYYDCTGGGGGVVRMA